MVSGTVAIVCTHEVGHFARLRWLIEEVVSAGRRVVVFTDVRFRDDVEVCGGIFHDLYGRLPIARVDAETIPRPARQVTYAGFCAEEVAAELASVDPDVIVYDSFSVVSLVASRLLGLPHVCVCSGHNLDPHRFREALERGGRVKVSSRCEEAVRRLRDRYSLEDASPFSYMSTLSPYLNLYCEPDEYLEPEMRAAFEPVECIGSLGPRPWSGPSPFSGEDRYASRAYVSFGTVIWRYFAKEAGHALESITEALTRRGDVEVVVSLGGYGGDVVDLARDHVRVLPYVDQWRALEDADLFVTHHGLNSTHEAAYLRVPMLSYPFFWDQPGLAAKCAALGIAEPLTPTERAPISPSDVERALERLGARFDVVQARLSEAKAWEERVVARRADVTKRVLSLASGPVGCACGASHSEEPSAATRERGSGGRYWT